MFVRWMSFLSWIVAKLTHKIDNCQWQIQRRVPGVATPPTFLKKRAITNVAVLKDLVFGSYMSTRFPNGMCLSALRCVTISTLSTMGYRMGEQDLAGLTWKSIHSRETLQLDASRVKFGFGQNNCRKIVLQLCSIRVIVAGYT